MRDILRSPLNFNPHSRKGSDLILKQAAQRAFISIHTPARGVTVLAVPVVIYITISIHTPARGVTYATIMLNVATGISIHTPARGVTRAYITMVS